MSGYDVDEVKEVRGPTDANKLLGSEGWQLLSVLPAQSGVGSTHVIYVLGRKTRKAGLFDRPAADDQA